VIPEPERLADIWDHWATRYDGRHPTAPAGPAAAFLARRIPPAGSALELGVGAGRLALELARAHGVRVHGIDISPTAVRRLAEATDTPLVTVALGDMSAIGTRDAYDLVYSVASTFYSLLTQAQQVACFSSATQALRRDGRLVLECFSPAANPDALRPRGLIVRDSGASHLSLSATSCDPLTQRIDFHEVRLAPEGTDVVPVPIRYAWPSELDLMAHLAGLTLQERYGTWDEQPFTATSRSHVSVYTRAR